MLLFRNGIRNDEIFEVFSVFILILFGVFFTYIMLDHYVDGDQVHYLYVYENLWKLNFLDAYEEYIRSLSSLELPYFLLIYLLGGYIDREIYLAASNVILIILAFKLLKKLGSYNTVAIFFLLTNFYFFVLYIPAERLKFAFIFLFLGLILFYNGKKKLSISFLIISSLTHVSLIILFVPFILKESWPVIKKRPIIAFVFIIILLIFLIFLSQHLISKFMSYSALGGNLSDVLKVVLLMFFSIFSMTKRKSNIPFVVLSFFWIGICVFILGGSRVNMLAFFLFIFFSIGYKKGLNVYVMSLLIYFSYASYNFVDTAIQYGDAFYFAK